jgi:hypothetical protein
MPAVEDSWLSEEVLGASRNIYIAMGHDPDDEEERDALQLTGLEPIVAAIALKVVTGVVSGFLGRLVYDRWKAARNKKQLEELASQLSRAIGDGITEQAVDERVMRDDIVNALTLEGLTEEQAAEVCKKVLVRVRVHLQGSG